MIIYCLRLKMYHKAFDMHNVEIKRIVANLK